MIKLDVNTTAQSLTEAKRLYLDRSLEICWDCPDCEKKVWFDHCCPIISYGNYCHVFYCDHCGFESHEKMYNLVNINDGDSTIDVVFN